MITIQKKIYNENPLEVAKEFEASGIQYLHLVDLDGAKSKHIVNHKILETIASKTRLKIDFGGGLKTDEDLKIAFESGANQITGGSIAVKDPATFTSWIHKYGSDRIILGADANDEKIAVSGWQEESEEELIPFIQKYQEKGITYVICTDISKDGMLEGPAFGLYQKILDKCNFQPQQSVRSQSRPPQDNLSTPLEVTEEKQRDLSTSLEVTENGQTLKLIASGGISTFNELPRLAEIGCEGVIIGKAIYENRISLKQLEKFIITRGAFGDK